MNGSGEAVEEPITVMAHPKSDGVEIVGQTRLTHKKPPIEVRQLNQRTDTPPPRERWTLPKGESLREYAWLQLPLDIQRKRRMRKGSALFAWVRKTTTKEDLERLMELHESLMIRKY